MAIDKPESVGLPAITFLYTMDQIAAMLGITQDQLTDRYLYYHMRSTGKQRPSQMRTVNIAQPEDKPDWRITQREFIRWLRAMGIKVDANARVL